MFDAHAHTACLSYFSSLPVLARFINIPYALFGSRDTKWKQRTVINFNHRLLRLIKIKIRLFVRCKVAIDRERERVRVDSAVQCTQKGTGG